MIPQQNNTKINPRDEDKPKQAATNQPPQSPDELNPQDLEQVSGGVRMKKAI